MLKIFQSGMFWYCWISYVDVILKLIVILGIASSNDKWLCFNSKLRYLMHTGLFLCWYHNGPSTIQSYYLVPQNR
jgi:hypothetical protein